VIVLGSVMIVPMLGVVPYSICLYDNVPEPIELSVESSTAEDSPTDVAAPVVTTGGIHGDVVKV
jgi:hypothetical protein